MAEGKSRTIVGIRLFDFLGMYAQGLIPFFPGGHFGELVGAEIDHADGGYQEHEFVDALEHK